MFKRTKEDFVCEHCDIHVQGTGYTNHCPKCLWSKHVDASPGDRAAACGGAMRPLRVEGTTPNYRIVHECERCHIRRINAADARDSIEALLAIAGRE